MTKIYMMEIRDLTNEAKELNAQAIEIKTFEKQAQKKIEILAENHISAIASCLNHQLDEIIKITNRFQVYYSFFDKSIQLDIRKKGDDYYYLLRIKPYHYTEGTTFIIRKDNTIVTYPSMDKTLNNCEFELETILELWKGFKEGIAKAIENKIKEIQRTNIEKQKAMQNKVSLYENFEI